MNKHIHHQDCFVEGVQVCGMAASVQKRIDALPDFDSAEYLKTPAAIAAFLEDLIDEQDANVLRHAVQIAVRALAAPAPVEQDERARFEAWSRRVAPAYGFDKDEHGQYIAYPVHAGWAAWQARASLAAPASAEPAQQSTMQKVHIASVPGGESESVDTEEFRLLIAKVQGFDDGEPIFGATESDFIAHINAHVARQVQAARDQALEEVAVMAEGWGERGVAGAVRSLKRSPQAAASTEKGEK